MVVSEFRSRLRCNAPLFAARASFIVSIAVIAAGCAQKPAAQQPHWRVAGPTVNLNADQVAPRGLLRLRIEGDGLPEQAPPTVRKGRPSADDPTEPFSPNYGTVPVDREPIAPRNVGAGEGRGVAPVALDGRWAADVLPEDLPADLPPDFRTALLNARR